MTEQEDLFEFQVFAAAFRIPGAIERFADELSPTDVGMIHGYTGIYEVYRSMVSYHRKIGGDTVEPVAFKSWLKGETDIVDALGGQVGLDTLVKTSIDTEISDVDTIIKMIEFRGNKRRQLDATQKLKELINNKAHGTDEDIDKITKLTEQIKSLGSEIDYDPLASVRTGFDIGRGADALWDMPNFLPTQFPSINKAIGYSADKGGFLRGTVNSITAMSGLGKSTLVKCFCNHWLKNGETILFVNFEEPEAHWERTLMTQVCECNVYEQSERLSDAEKKKHTLYFKEKMVEWGDRLMVRHDPDTVFFEDLERWFRDILGHGARKPTVIVIDTIQSLFIKSGGHSRWGEFEQIMVSLEKLAKDMDALIIITTQQNSNAEKAGRTVISQSDQGSSITIIQKSTVAIFITPMTSDDDTAHPNLMQIQIPKNRITGTVFNGSPPLILYNDAIKSYVPWTRPNIAEMVNNIIDEDFGETF